jgi:hypothetical protein
MFDPGHLIRIIIRHEDTDQGAIRERGNLWGTRIVSLSGSKHLVPIMPGGTIIIRDKSLDIKRTVRRSLKDHHKSLATIIKSARNTIHTISTGITVSMQACWATPSTPLIMRDGEHGTLVIMGEFFGVGQLDLAPPTHSHKRLPDSKWRSFFGGLRCKAPRISAIHRPTDGDPEMCGAVVSFIMVAEGC